MDIDDTSFNPLVIPKEEKFDFDDDFEKKYDPPKRGRTRSLGKKGDKVDIKAKLERSRQSARECRARKKLRYQYLEEVITETEKSIVCLRRELEMLRVWSKELDEGRLSEHVIQYRTSCVEKKLAHPFEVDRGRHMMVNAPGTSHATLSLSPSGATLSPYMALLLRTRTSTSPS